MQAFDAAMIDRGPKLQIVIGQAQSGKSTLISHILQRWRAAGAKTLAIDAVCPDPPLPKHIAHHSTYWCEAPPDEVPRDVRVVACDEGQRFMDRGRVPAQLFQECIFRGQHTNPHLGGVAFVLGSQTPASMGVDVWRQAARIVLLRAKLATDMERRRVMSLAGILPVHLDMLPQLPPGYAIVWDDELGVMTPYVPEWHHR